MMRRRVTTVATKALVFSQKKHLYTQPKVDKTQRHPIRVRDQKEKEQWSWEALGEKEKKALTTPTTYWENVRYGTLEFLTLFQHLCPFYVWHYLILLCFFFLEVHRLKHNVELQRFTHRNWYIGIWEVPMGRNNLLLHSKINNTSIHCFSLSLLKPLNSILRTKLSVGRTKWLDKFLFWPRNNLLEGS